MNDQHKGIVSRFLDEAFDKGNLTVTNELLASDHVFHDPNNSWAPDSTSSVSYKQFIAMYRDDLLDLHLSIQFMVATGDKVLTIWTMSGTYEREIMGGSPTGKPVTIIGIELDRISEGKIMETWVYWDSMSVMQQLGTGLSGAGQGFSAWLPASGQAVSTWPSVDGLHSDASIAAEGQAAGMWGAAGGQNVTAWSPLNSQEMGNGSSREPRAGEQGTSNGSVPDGQSAGSSSPTVPSIDAKLALDTLHMMRKLGDALAQLTQGATLQGAQEMQAVALPTHGNHQT